MIKQNIVVEVFGANIICASCVNAPSSKDTYEWLDAAISRRYPGQPFTIEYIDIELPLTTERHKEIAEQIANDEYFYPLVMVNGEMVGEGHIQLKPILKVFEENGFTSAPQ